MKTATVQARFWSKDDQTYRPADARTEDVTLSLTKMKDRDVIEMKGGPTGCESFDVSDKVVKGMSNYGWLANFGTGPYERCDVTSGEMSRAFQQLGLA